MVHRRPCSSGGVRLGCIRYWVSVRRVRTTKETETERRVKASLGSVLPHRRGDMALRRKGARRIVVDGTAYRWRLRGRPTYNQGLAWTPCTFAVEHAETPRMTLVVTTSLPHASNWVGREARPVLPSDVAHAIEHALREGWTPVAPGSPFHVDWSDGFASSP